MLGVSVESGGGNKTCHLTSWFFGSFSEGSRKKVTKTSHGIDLERVVEKTKWPAIHHWKKTHKPFERIFFWNFFQAFFQQIHVLYSYWCYL